MSKLISNRAQVEVSNCVKNILSSLFIDNWQSEPHRQFQNPAERCYQNVKTGMNILLDRTGAPAYTQLLAMLFAYFVVNFAFNVIINKMVRT